MTPFSAIITPQSVSFTGPNGKVYSVEKDHPNWEDILEKIKEIKAQLNGKWSDDFSIFEKFGITIDNFDSHKRDVSDLLEELIDLVDVSHTINELGAGKVVVRNGVVYYENEPINLLITERILWGISQGFDMTAHMLFLDHSMNNPSSRAVNEMYRFMEQNRMGITEDGHILGYKRVRADFKDIYTGTFDNSPGQIVEMKRNKVNDNPTETCSHGLHFCSMSYLPHYGAYPGNKVVIVKVNPADIVSVPIDYGNAKVRCCRYEVMSEYTGTDLEDILTTKAVWSDDDDFSNDADNRDDDVFGSDYWEEDDEDGSFGSDYWEEDDEATVEAADDSEDVLDDEFEHREINNLIEDDKASTDIALSVAKKTTSDGIPYSEISGLNDLGMFDDAVARLAGVINKPNGGLNASFETIVSSEFPGVIQENDVEGGVNARFDAILSAEILAEQKRRKTEAEKIITRLTEEARQKVIEEFVNELMREATITTRSWFDDFKKAPNLPTEEEVQGMLGALAADLRRAEIAAGVSSAKFDWENWLNKRAAEKILSDAGEIHRNTAMDIAEAVVARRFAEPEMIAEVTPNGLVSASTQASVRAALEELKRKLGQRPTTASDADDSE